MTTHRRKLAFAGAGAAAAAMLFGSPAVASAAPNTELVRITGSFTTVDDDFDFDTTATSTFDRLVAVDSAHNNQVLVIPTTQQGCAGGEVRAELRLQVSRLSDGRIRVQDAPGGLGLQMFEGASCFSNDLDGSANITDVVVANNFQVSDSAFTGNQDEGGNDSAAVRYVITHTR